MIEIPDDISKDKAIRTARILAKALHHSREENRELRREYSELLSLMRERANYQQEERDGTPRR